MSTADRLLQALLSKYKTINNGELEMRFRSVNFQLFTEIYNVLLNNKEYARGNIEYSINTITQNAFEKSQGSQNIQYIRKQIFTQKGDKISDEFIQKEKVTKPITVNDYLSYNIVLSTETPSRSFSISQDALVRFKIRISFVYNNEWRFDLTAVKSGIIKELSSHLLAIKTKLFVQRSYENFIESLDQSLLDGYEVEIEYIGDYNAVTADSFNIVGKLFAGLNPNYLIETVYQDEIYNIAQYIKSNRAALQSFKTGGKRLKDLLNQARSISKYEYAMTIFPPIGYYLTDKTDGVRAVISINGNRCRILASTMMEYTIASGAKPGVTIADCELVYKANKKGGNNASYFITDAIGGASTYVIYVFDVMVYYNENISDKNFVTRHEKIQPVVELINTFISQDGGKAVAKHYAKLEAATLEATIKSIYNAEYPYEVDGLILTSPDDSYEHTMNYKWKPYDKTTIDFIAIKCPDSVLGKFPYIKRDEYTLYILYTSIRYEEQQALGLDSLPFTKSLFDNIKSDRYPIQFSPSINPLAYLYYHKDSQVKLGDRNIVELRRMKTVDGKTKHYVDNYWELVKIREDRKIEKSYYGNSYRVAEMTYMNYIDEFGLSDLWEPKLGYFSKMKDNIYQSPNKFKRYVIGRVINDNMSMANLIVDLASGRGADLYRYIVAGVKQAVFVDKDKTALVELISRKFELSLKKKDTSLLMYIMEQDLTAPYDAIASKISSFTRGEKADAVACNFAIHYFCANALMLKNFLQLVASVVKVNGVFTYTTLNGDLVFRQLKNIQFDGSWIMKENGIVKYAIKKKYTGNKLTSVGQLISVKLPLSDEMYDEPLANIDHINSILKTLGFNVEINESFNTFDDDFKSEVKKDIYDKLTADDKLMIGMHQLVVARKIK